MSCEKFTNWAGDKGIHIPSSALTLAKIKEGEHLDFHVADDVIVTMKHQMTASTPSMLSRLSRGNCWIISSKPVRAVSSAVERPVRMMRTMRMTTCRIF